MTDFNYSGNAKEFFGNPEAFTKTPDFEKMFKGDMSGYESPIRMIVGEMETKMEADTMSVIQRYGIDVDKEELIKALNYDRGQYEKGYADACNSHKLWNIHQIACMLADIFKDRCACNYCGNDEWLPKVCDLADTSCPDTFGVACWEQFVANYNNKPKEKG